MTCDLDSSAPAWLIDYPASAAVFKQHQLDTSCDGKSVRYLCTSQGIDPQAVYRELRAAIESPRGGGQG